jgi:NCAIR mutase (PurE)-related protein
VGLSAAIAPRLRLVDSIAELQTGDAGCIAVSGSHGGLSAARYALAVRPLLSVFNDAGVGRDAAGIAGLALLQAEGLAACAVSNLSACIGQAQSTWVHGVVSHANACALALGVEVGLPLQRALARGFGSHS